MFCWGFVTCYILTASGVAHGDVYTKLFLPCSIGTLSSGACIGPPAALLSTARRPHEGCLWWSCTAQRSPLLLPRYHEVGGYDVIHSHFCMNTTIVSRKVLLIVICTQRVSFINSIRLSLHVLNLVSACDHISVTYTWLTAAVLAAWHLSSSGHWAVSWSDLCSACLIRYLPKGSTFHRW